MATLEQYKLMLIYHYLKKHNWSRAKAALELGVPRRTLRSWIPKLRAKGFDIPMPDRIPRKKCTTCNKYYKLMNKDGQWECYACKYLEDK